MKGLAGFDLVFIGLHFGAAVLLSVICTAVLAGVGLLTPAPEPQRIRDLTFGTRHPDAGRAPSRRRDAVLSAALALVLVTLWIVFR